MGNHIAVVRHRQQFVTAAFTDLFGGHLACQLGEAQDVQADRVEHDINRFQELVAVQVVQHRQVNAGAAFGNFSAHAVETFLQQQREVNRQMDIAGSWDESPGAEEALRAATSALVSALGTCLRPVVLVSNEVGQGVVPASASGRRFRDAMGILNAQVAGVCDQVFFCTAGLPQRLK